MYRTRAPEGHPCRSAEPEGAPRPGAGDAAVSPVRAILSTLAGLAAHHTFSSLPPEVDSIVSTTGQPDEISDALIDAVCQRLASNQPVRRTLPERGRLHVDRQLPFLCVYRRPHDRTDAGTDHLVKTEASYLIAPDRPSCRAQVSRLAGRVVETLAREFGAFLIVELWSLPDGGRANDPAVPGVAPTFVVHAPRSGAVAQTVEVLRRRLERITVLKQRVRVEVRRDGQGHPPGRRPVIPSAAAHTLGCATIGLAVPPVYRDVDSQAEFPQLMRALRRSLGLALRQAFFEFSSLTTRRPTHYHALGRTAVVRAVWEIDRRLAGVSDAFDYLLLLTPVNSAAAFRTFARQGFERVPRFHYRPLPIDPALLKRQLYGIPIERVEDPALQQIFQEKQEELELKITMLRDRDTPRFVPESLQLFGAPDRELVELAESLLDRLPGRAATRSKSPVVDARRFAERARAEFTRYRRAYPDFQARARVSTDAASLIVSRGTLLIPPELRVSRSRVEALLAHEVGTHLVTYYNGRAQPFRQLYSGLAAYEELQEGMAVLAEYLVGGLTRARMRQLAARVVAVRHLVDGASFVETFRRLCRTHGLSQRAAYKVTMRVYRGGGLTKDVVYLRGLRSLVRYLRRGGEVRPLLVGKLALDHVPIVRELQYRKVLGPTPLEPRYLERRDTADRLARVRGGDGSLLHLVCESG